MQVLQDKTKRMSDLLSDWTQSSESLKITATISHPQKIEYSIVGGNELDAIMAIGLSRLAHQKSLQVLVNFDFREFDYFLRDINSKPSFQDSNLADFNRVKSIFCLAIVNSCNQEQDHKLLYLNLKYNAALKNYCLANSIDHELIELVDIEPDLVVVKLREGLDKPHQIMDEISEHYSNLFQDSEINVIPE